MVSAFPACIDKSHNPIDLFVDGEVRLFNNPMEVFHFAVNYCPVTHNRTERHVPYTPLERGLSIAVNIFALVFMYWRLYINIRLVKELYIFLFKGRVKPSNAWEMSMTLHELLAFKRSRITYAPEDISHAMNLFPVSFDKQQLHLLYSATLEPDNESYDKLFDKTCEEYAECLKPNFRVHVCQCLVLHALNPRRFVDLYKIACDLMEYREVVNQQCDFHSVDTMAHVYELCYHDRCELIQMYRWNFISVINYVYVLGENLPQMFRTSFWYARALMPFEDIVRVENFVFDAKTCGALTLLRNMATSKWFDLYSYIKATNILVENGVIFTQDDVFWIFPREQQEDAQWLLAQGNAKQKRESYLFILFHFSKRLFWAVVTTGFAAFCWESLLSRPFRRTVITIDGMEYTRYNLKKRDPYWPTGQVDPPSIAPRCNPADEVILGLETQSSGGPLLPVNKKPKKRKSKRARNTSTEPIFGDWFHDDVVLDELSKVSVSQAFGLLGAALKHNPVIKTDEERVARQDAIQHIKAAYAFSLKPPPRPYVTISQREEDELREERNEQFRELLRKAVFSVYGEVCDFGTDIPEYELPKGYCKHKKHGLQMSDIPNRHLFDQLGKKGEIKQPAIVSVSPHPNYLFELVSDNPTRTGRYPLQVLRNIMSSAKRKGMADSDVLDLISGKLTTPRFDKVHGQYINWLEYRWTFDYFAPQVFYYEVLDKRKFEEVLVEKCRDHKSVLMEFCRDFLTFGNLLPSERVRVRQDRVDSVVNFMRSPKYQMMFLSGVPKHQIVQDILENHRGTLTRVVRKGEVMVRHKASKKADRKISIMKRRDLKYADNYEEVFSDVEPQSRTDEVLSDFVPQALGFALFGIGFASLSFATVFIAFLMDWYRYTDIFGLSEQFRARVLASSLNISELVTIFDRHCRTWVRVMRDKDKVRLAVEKWRALLTDPMEFIRMNSKIILDIKACVHCAYHAYNKDVSATVEWASQVVLSLGLSYSSFNDIHDFARRVSAKPTTFEFQGKSYSCTIEQRESLIAAPNDAAIQAMIGTFELMELQAVSDITSAIMAILHARGLTHISDADVRSANAQYTYLTNARKDVEGTIAGIQIMASTLCKLIFGYDPCDTAFTGFVSDLYIMQAFADEHYVRGSFAEAQHHSEVMRLYHRGLAMEKCEFYERMQTHQKLMFRDVSRKLASMASVVAPIVYRGSSVRPVPICICFTGVPKSGKSWAAMELMKLICRLENKTWMASDTYSFANAAEKYYEGYLGQKFMLFDDAFKEADIDIRRRVAGDIINMVNNVPYKLTMAALESKANTYFDSEYVFLSTNIANSGLDEAVLDIGLTDINAFKRRLHIVLHREEALPETDSVYDDRTKFRVDKCNYFGIAKGTYLTLGEIASLAFNARKVELKKLDDSIKQSDLDEYLSSHPLQLRPQARDEGEPSNFIRGFVAYIRTKNLPYLDNDRNVELLIAGFYMLIALSTAGAIAAMFYNVTKIEPSSVDRRAQRATHRIRLQRRIRKAAVFPLADVETTSKRDSFSECINQTLKNTSLSITFAGTINGVMWGENCAGFHIRDGYVMTVAHAYALYEKSPDFKISITWKGGRVVMDRPEMGVWPDGDDVIIFKVKFGDMPPSIYRYLLDDEAFTIPIIGEELSVVLPYGSSVASRDCLVTQSFPAQYKAGDELIIIDVPLKYSGDTEKGDSGSPVFTMSSSGSPKLVAMHVGRQSSNIRNYGVAYMFTKDYVDELIYSLVPSDTPFPHEIEEIVPTSMGSKIPSRTAIHRSPLFNYLSDSYVPLKIPAKLSPFLNVDGVWKNPLHIALSKQKQYAFSADVDEDAIEYLKALYPRAGGKVRHYEEAMNIIPGIPNSVSINLSTSLGYPFSFKSTGGKKPLLYHDEAKRVCIDPEFKVYMDELRERLYSGGTMSVLWAIVLKDETRPYEKVHAGKTRAISTCPVDYLLMCREFFIDFINYVQNFQGTKPVSVGMNVTSLQWTMLYKRMSAKGQSIISGDYENYDGRLPADVGKVALAFINWWYDDTYGHIREHLFSHVFSARHIAGRYVYRVVDGNPSGNPLTSIYNSLCNIIMLYTVLVNDVKAVSSEFELAVYGDDNLVAVDRPGITSGTFAPHILRRFGLKYTHFSKSDVEVHDTLESVSYLGRSFRYDMVYRAPLSLDVILEIPLWINGDIDFSVVLPSISDSFHRELSQHPRYVFDKYSEMFFAALAKLERSEQLTTLARSHLLTYNQYYIQMYGCTDFEDTGSFTIEPTSSGHIVSGVSPLSDFVATLFTDNANLSPAVISTDAEGINFRSMHPASITEVNQMGTFRDATDVVHSEMGSAALPPVVAGDHTTPLYHLKGSLDREYQMQTYTWNTSSGTNYTLGTLSFPDVLFTQPYVANLIKNFLYFRGGIRVGLRIQASTFLYGSLLMSYRPNLQFDASNEEALNIYRASGFPSMLASACTNDTIYFDVPFVAPRRYLECSGTGKATTQMGTITLQVLTPLININGGVDSCKVTVTAAFVDPEVTFPVVPTSDGGYINVEVQSNGKVISEPFSGTKTDTTYGRHSRTSRVTSTHKMVHNKIQEQPFNQFCPPAFGPSDVSRTVVKTAVTSETRVSETNFLSPGIDEMDISYVTSIPMLVSVSNISSTTTSSVELSPVGPAPADVDGYLCYVDYVTHMFTHYSGSYKFKAYIFASQMHSVRLAFYVAPTLTSNWDDIYHSVVDVHGDTSYEVTVPFVASAFNYDTSEVPKLSLFVRVLSYSQPVPAASTPIYIALFKAGGSDFKVAGLANVEFTTTPQSSPRADFAKDFEPLHEGMLGYDPGNVADYDRTTSFREIMNKVQPVRFRDAGEHSIIPRTGDSAGNKVFQGSLCAMNLYSYYRGAVQASLFVRTPVSWDEPITTMVYAARRGTSTQGIYPGCVVLNKYNNFGTLEVPYIDNVAYRSLSYALFGEPEVVLPSGGAFYSFSGGEDFTMIFLRPPRRGHFGYVNPALGYGALSGYANYYPSETIDVTPFPVYVSNALTEPVPVVGI